MRFILRLLIYSIRLSLRFLPDSIRSSLRKQHILLRLYSKVIIKSRLFFGAPSPRIENRRYKRLLKKQHSIMRSLRESYSPFQIDVVVVGNDKNLPILIEQLQTEDRVRKVYWVFFDNCAFKNTFKEYAKVEIGVERINYDAPILFLRSIDLLAANAVKTFLFHSVNKHKSQDQPLIISCDIDSISDKQQPYSPKCSPQWNPDLQLSTGYLETGLLIFGRKAIESLQKFLFLHNGQNCYSLWLSNLYLSGVKFNTHHLAYSLIHVNKRKSTNWHNDFKRYHSSYYKNFFEVYPAKNNIEKNSIKWIFSKDTLVSIIIPTYNAKDLVKACIESIIDKSNYRNFEILLVDNNSDDPEAIAYFELVNCKYEQVTVLKYPKPFNYSAINNFAVKYANGSVYAFVNNDIEVIEPEWMDYMLGHVLRQDIGCVGAKLLYPNNRIQHAGVVLGYGGGAGHAHKLFPSTHSGYMDRLSCTNNYSAVTAACLMVKKADFEAVGGFNEENLKVAFNDVDFCLEIVRTGKRNLYCAEAVLYHHESVTRGSEDTPEKRQRFESELEFLQSKWSSFIEDDPCYSPNLSKRHSNFSLRE